MTFHRFLDELKRRHVFRVAGVYLVAAWGTIEAVTGISELLTDSDAPGKVVAVLALAGFPLAVLLAWFYDITRQGIVRTPDAAETAPAARPLPVLSARATGMFGLGMVVALLSFAGYSILVRPAPGGALAEVRALAVLPFESDADPTWADGLAEELIRRLSREDSLQVTARTSAFRFRDTQEPPAEIARQLGVQALLAGKVRRVGAQYAVSVELIDGASGRVLWSPETYAVSESELLDLHDRITLELLTQLGVGESGRMAAAAGTQNEQAAKLYALGSAQLNARVDRALREALGYFQRATEADPEYAAAYAGLAQAYALLPIAGSFDPVEAFTRGMTAASMAISLDPLSAEAHAAVGQLVQNYDWQPSASLRSYERAIEFNPNLASAHQWYAEALVLLGRVADAEAEVKRALELDPLSPSALHAQALVQVAAGDYSSALATLLDGASLFPEFRAGHMSLALTAVLSERYPEMRRALAAWAAGDAQLEQQLAAVAEGVQRPAARGAALRALAQAEPALGGSVAALWYAALQDREAALAALQRAYGRRADPNFPSILVHPLLAPLHALPAYQAMVADVGVTPPTL